MLMLSRLQKNSWLPVFALALLGCLPAYGADAVKVAAVYANDVAITGAPVRAGDLTLGDVLEAHTRHKKIPLAGTTPAGLVPPVVIDPAAKDKPKLNSSAEGDMLLQGMKSALKDTAAPLAAPALQAPKLPGASVAYQPGQAPQDIAKALTTTPPDAAKADSALASPTVSPAAKPKLATPTVDAANCTPHIDTWTRSCEEAGYPPAFTGQIKGETRVVCPSGVLQDVWVSNSCAAPGDEASLPASSSPRALPPSAETLVTSASGKESAAIIESGAAQLTTDGSSKIDAVCGTANGLAVAQAPSSGLCEAGDATPLSGAGPWRWSCKGSNGGMTVSCAAAVSDVAPKAITEVPEQKVSHVAQDGQCGAANGTSMDHAPKSSLCVKGSASRVSGDGPWTWACSGMNGGAAAACSTVKKSDGVCGSATSSGADQMPMGELCQAGIASAVTGEGPWNWTCSGMNGGAAATCVAATKRDAVCGSASTVGHTSVPQEHLCSVGTPSTVSGAGPWNWACSGLNGGSQVSCSAVASVNGVCGSAHGQSFAEVPADNLCLHGSATRVVGQGASSWSWSCVGVDGGETESCMASHQALQGAKDDKAQPIAQADSPLPIPSAAQSDADLCGSAAELAAVEAPTTDLCRSGKASSVTGDNPWSWTCTDAGKKSACATLSMTTKAEAPASASSPMSLLKTAPSKKVADDDVAACGGAADHGVSQAPSTDLCRVGKASNVQGKGPWSWSCAKGKSKTSCEAPAIVDAACGDVNGSTQRSAPRSDLCHAGRATSVQGNGPWLWSCVGSGGGVSVSCSAQAQAQARVDGLCGAAAGGTSLSKPAANLCDSGTASNVYGDGPWTWTCSGMNGGIASSCATAKNVPPPPAPPGAVVNGLCGASNGVAMAIPPIDDLCVSGTATSVSGNGPWNWSCLGENSGMTVSCTALLQPPAPITGVCGQSSGVPTLIAPKSGLCGAGISSAVSGRGPWTWSCSGTNGGGAVACVAPLAGSDSAPTPSLVTPSLDAPAAEAPAPKAAKLAPVASSNLVTPKLPSGALPPIASGTMPAAPSASDVVTPKQVLTPPKLAAAEGSDDVPGNHMVLSSDIATLEFAPASDIMSPETTGKLDKLMGIMRVNNSIRITLTAYADSAHATPRDARRLSLSRALAARDYLTANGIPTSRVDVRALGANVHSGTPDRIDIKIN